MGDRGYGALRAALVKAVASVISAAVLVYSFKPAADTMAAAAKEYAAAATMTAGAYQDMRRASSPSPTPSHHPAALLILLVPLRRCVAGSQLWFDGLDGWMGPASPLGCRLPLYSCHTPSTPSPCRGAELCATRGKEVQTCGRSRDGQVEALPAAAWR